MLVIGRATRGVGVFSWRQTDRSARFAGGADQIDEGEGIGDDAVAIVVGLGHEDVPVDEFAELAVEIAVHDLARPRGIGGGRLGRQAVGDKADPPGAHLVQALHNPGWWLAGQRFEPEQAVEPRVLLGELHLGFKEGAQWFLSPGSGLQLPGDVRNLEFGRLVERGPEQILQRVEIVVRVGVRASGPGGDLPQVYAPATTVPLDEVKGGRDETLVGGLTPGHFRG